MSLTWKDEFLLGNARMDTTHREFIEMLGQAARHHERGDIGQTMRQFRHLLSHTEAHFAQEERWMLGSSYPEPAAQAHVADHDAVLRIAREVLRRYETGRGTDTLGYVLDHLG
ncbi:MAG TPA: hemerythrin domain-containing protein, partial [Gemmatimonadales bacterium]|nr:hemerythrin domain-containing protein [Gemmatimonadales bacterium]